MMTRTTRHWMLVAVLAGVAALGLFAAGPVSMTSARAQSISVLSDAAVEVSDIGRLEGAPVVYVEFADGARCVISDNGAGAVDCDW